MKLRWTQAWRRMNKKGKADEAGKKRRVERKDDRREAAQEALARSAERSTGPVHPVRVVHTVTRRGRR